MRLEQVSLVSILHLGNLANCLGQVANDSTKRSTGLTPRARRRLVLHLVKRTRMT